MNYNKLVIKLLFIKSKFSCMQLLFWFENSLVQFKLYYSVQDNKLLLLFLLKLLDFYCVYGFMCDMTDGNLF